MMKPYVGVTGFSTRNQIGAVLHQLPEHPSRLLMVGVGVSWKSLREIPVNLLWQPRFPSMATLQRIFPADPRTVNLIHYSAGQDHQADLLKDLQIIRQIVGEQFHGFQLNIVWPDPVQVAKFRQQAGYDVRLVLQIGDTAYRRVGSIKSLVEAVAPYAGMIDDVLVDLSGGQGLPLQPTLVGEMLRALDDQEWGIGLGAAGGLGPDTLHLVEPLVRGFPDLNLDAEGKLRTAENDLDLQAVHAYLDGAFRLFTPSPVT